MAVDQMVKDLFYERKCPICGTVFCYTSAGWAYKIETRRKGKTKTNYYCRYSCYLKAQAQQEPKRKREGKKPKLFDNNKLRELKELLLSGVTKADCAKRFGCMPSTITYYIDHNPEFFEELTAG